MRLSLIAVAVLAVLAVAVGATAHHRGKFRKSFTAFLNGFNEVPSVSTTAKGTTHVRLDPWNKVIRYTLHTGKLEGEIWQAHLHLGQKHTNGGVVAFLCGSVAQPLEIPDGTPECPPTTGGSVSGVIEADDILPVLEQGIDAGEIDEVATAIKAGSVYVNVHSERFPNGEIRGQLR